MSRVSPIRTKKEVYDRFVKLLDWIYDDIERCEHGVRDSDWCEDCNKAYKEARHEAGEET